MVGSCVAVNCTNRQRKGSNISFFHFPLKNQQLLKIWIQNKRRDKWNPSKHSLLCSTHFKESCFVVRPGKRGRLLKEDAAPTEFPEINCVSKPEQKSPKKRVLHEPILPASPSKVRKVVQLDHAYETDKENTSTGKKKKLRQEAQGLYAELFYFFVYFKCCSGFLLYFYKCSTSVAFT